MFFFCDRFFFLQKLVNAAECHRKAGVDGAAANAQHREERACPARHVTAPDRAGGESR